MLNDCQSIHQKPPTRQNKPVIQIAKSLLTIIKLSRLLFGKILICCKKWLPFFTGMPSKQLQSSKEFPEKAFSCLCDLWRHLKVESAPDHPWPNFAGTAQLLKAGFNSPLLIILLQVIPLISDTDSIPGQDSFKSWFSTWCTQFSLAIENLNDKIELYNPQ
jgi:hypothetical protein